VGWNLFLRLRGTGREHAAIRARIRPRGCIAALLLCTDLPSAQKEPLLVNYLQVGIDLAGMIRAGHPGWTGWGGHGSGRKLPIVFAGLLLGDAQLANLNQSFPKVSFGEDEQTAYGEAWTGAKVVFTGHSGIDAATGEGRSRGNGWGPYEHTPPSQWTRGPNTSESYRRCCTSVGWVAQALALRLMRAEPAWNHDAFFDYVDRWMHENDATFVKTIAAATGQNHDKEWAGKARPGTPSSTICGPNTGQRSPAPPTAGISPTMTVPTARRSRICGNRRRDNEAVARTVQQIFARGTGD